MSVETVSNGDFADIYMQLTAANIGMPGATWHTQHAGEVATIFCETGAVPRFGLRCSQSSLMVGIEARLTDDGVAMTKRRGVTSLHVRIGGTTVSPLVERTVTEVIEVPPEDLRSNFDLLADTVRSIAGLTIDGTEG